MPEHYTAATLEDTKFCNKCGRPTQHAVSGNRIGHCLVCLLYQEIAEHAARLRRGGVVPLRRKLGYFPGDEPKTTGVHGGNDAQG